MAQYTGTGSTVRRADDSGMSAWVGWIAFAGMMLMMLGVFHVIEGIVALTKSSYFLVHSSGLVVNVNYTTWGWVHIIAGCVVVAAGAGVLNGAIWARVIGVAVAFVSTIISIGFLSAYPIWSVLMIALSVVVIMALTVHGSDIKDDV
ncbi:MAG: hypothetical protein QOF53_2678 [Nocardioidaceae bacterium]|jgi:hypothetical protein|nr:hypothetical protein [Nocardioidaceae bacterium]